MVRKRLTQLEEQRQRQALLMAIRDGAGGRRSRRQRRHGNGFSSMFSVFLLSVISAFAILGLIYEYFL